MKEKGRAVIYVFGAIYLFYLAYQLFSTRMNGSADSRLMTVFSVAFGIAGIGLVIFALILYKNSKKAEEMQDKGQEESKEEKGLGD